MKAYTELAGINARHNKRENRMTVFCITLAVFLVASVFGMVSFEYIHMYDKLIRDHGNWHIVLSNVSKEEALSVTDEADIKAAVFYDTFNYKLDKDIRINGRPLCVVGTEPAFYTDFFPGTITEGHFPQNDSETLLNENAKSILGIEVGDEVSFQTPAGEFSYIVSGFAKDTSNSLAGDSLISILHFTTFEELAEVNGQKRELQYYIQFEKSLRIKQTIADLKKSHNWTEEQVSENTAILGIMGMSTNNYVLGLYAIALVLGILVILAGALMISGSMNTNIAQRTQYFGLLRCTGASRAQVRRIVRLEALNWLKLGIPIGIAASVIACWGICAVLAYGIGGEWEGMPVWKISPVGIIAGIVIGFVTVLLAAEAPAKRAAKVSPIAAVAGNPDNEYHGAPVKFGELSVPVSLGIRHTLSQKKSLILMTGSFALSIILFLCFSVMITWIQNALTTTKAYSPDLSLYHESYTPDLSRDFAADLRKVPGVKYVYGRLHKTIDAEYHEQNGPVDLISYDELQFHWAEKDLIKGHIAPPQDENGSVLVVFEKGNDFEIGDVLHMNGKELTVTGILSDSPFSSGDTPILICSEQTFEYVVGKSNYSVIELQFEKGASDAAVNMIRRLSGSGMILSDRRSSKTETNSTYLAFSVLVYGFLALIALIAVFNIVNSISMSVSSRRRQYGMMRAIGLDRQQLKQMILSESLTYGLFGCIAGCAIGLPLYRYFFTLIITNYWGIPAAIPLGRLLIILGVVPGASLLAAYGPIRNLSKSSIIEMTIN